MTHATIADVSARDDAVRRAANRLARARPDASAPHGASAWWDADFLGLDNVAGFRSASPPQRDAILADCAHGLVAEAWGIERTGIDYCARMRQEAETPDEQRLFALMEQDESAHAAWLGPLLAADAGPADTFNRFIAGLAREGAAQPLAYLLQVVLEGFGIVHYDTLAAGCGDPRVAATLRRMAVDEAMHHASGLALFRADRLTAGDRAFLLEATHAFLQMMRCGPQAVVAAFDHALGLPHHGAASLFASLDAAGATAAKLARLRKLLLRPGMEWLVEALERDGRFTPCTPGECAAIYAEMR